MQVLLRAVPQTLFDMPLFIEMTFFKMIPVSHSQKKREQLHGTYCVSNIDLDNLEKAIYDSLSGHIYVDDKQIVEHRTRKVWTKENPRIELEISSFKEFESPVCLKYPQ